MRTTAEECRRIGEFLARKLNACDDPVRFLLPEGGVSLLDAPGPAVPQSGGRRGAVHDPGARRGADRRPAPARLPHNINDPEFTDALVAAFTEVTR
ncbi:MAG TPA: Tm-1-like ATP-binding domain-containing protein [Pseudonocardiaceae bacterium]|nr:Tm-1-like ATP-binding domain-containing protein [Pseudonocardiaceae bacterium]